jgi:hypothetical protein
VTQIFSYKLPKPSGKYRHTRISKNSWHYASALCAYKSSEPWGIPIYAHSQIWYHKKTFDVMSRLYTHAFLSNLCEYMHTYTPKLYITLKTKHRYISAAHAYKTFWTFGNSNIHALQIYNIPNNSTNVISRSYMHTWQSESWGTHVLQTLQVHAISWNLLNVITWSRMHTWHSEPLGIHVLHTLQIHVIS